MREPVEASMDPQRRSSSREVRALASQAAAFVVAQLPAFLAPLLPPFREDVLAGAGVAPEVFGVAEGGHDLGG